MKSDSAKTIGAIFLVAMVLAATTPLFTSAAPGSSTAIFTLHNSNDFHAIHYGISVNGAQMLEGDIGINETVIKELIIPFPNGTRTFFPVQITISGSDSFIGIVSTLRNGEIVPANFNLH